ncbi:hypothetical protein D1007_38118 [Hordeum vulgare]|nr:hypothetical protein D1007_38118 [Hordeum vulgare]
MLRSLCQDGFDKPLATQGSGFVALAAKIAVALENVVVQVDKILDSECRDHFFEAATHVFSHLHLCEPGFDFGSMIVPVLSAAEAMKGPVEALVKRFARVVAPSFPDGAEADEGEDDTFDADDTPP